MLQSTKCFMHISMLICSIGIPGITEERRNCPHDLLNLLLSVKLSKYLTLVKLKALDFVWKCWAIRRKHLQTSGLKRRIFIFTKVGEIEVPQVTYGKRKYEEWVWKWSEIPIGATVEIPSVGWVQWFFFLLSVVFFPKQIWPIL